MPAQSPRVFKAPGEAKGNVISRAMRTNDDIARELRSIEAELIELELAASLHAVPTAAERQNMRGHSIF